MTIIDISRSLSPGIAVWPGDRPFEAEWTARIDAGSSVNIGAVSLSLHTGTHVDAPLHFQPEGAALDELPLEAFVGDALVVDLTEAGGDAIRPRHLEALGPAPPPRVLFRTRSSDVADDRWEGDFMYFAPEAIDLLGDRGVVLIGTDAPSVDAADSTELPAHHALARRGIVNLENLRLSGVRPGVYGLVALPLKLSGMDAAPVRAVLIAGGRWT